MSNPFIRIMIVLDLMNYKTPFLLVNIYDLCRRRFLSHAHKRLVTEVELINLNNDSP